MSPDRLKVNLVNVQETLLLPLGGRAVEPRKRKSPLFEKTAVVIIERSDDDLSKMAQNFDELTLIAWIKRSLVCDKGVKNFMTGYPEGMFGQISG